jgi:hypothetical protein
LSIDWSLLKSEFEETITTHPLYGKNFYVVIKDRNEFNKFIVKFKHMGDWYASDWNLEDYPLKKTYEDPSKPEVKFVTIPPCPIHRNHKHPNVYSRGNVCWGRSRPLRGSSLLSYILYLDYLLKSPNEESPAP